jgi:hypothetical protein
MTDTGRLRRALIERMLDGGGTASRSERRSAFENAGLAELLRTLDHRFANFRSPIFDTMAFSN